MTDELRDLLTTAPTEFVAARDSLAKAWRAAGRKADATAVAALRRPTPVDWALNTVAATDEELSARATASFVALRDAQTAALDDPEAHDALRSALTDARAVIGAIRAAAERVLKQAGRPPSDAAALAGRINEMMVNIRLLEQWRACRLGTSAVEAADPFADLPEPTRARPPRPAKPARSTRSTPVATDAVTAVPEEEDQEDESSRAAEARAVAEAREAAERRAQLEGERDQAARAVAAADAARVEARSEHETAEAELAAARRRVEAAVAGLELADQAHGAAAAELARLTAQLADG